MATPAIRALVFSPLPAGEANQGNSTKRSRDRQKALVDSLSKYKEGTNISKWFAEFMDPNVHSKISAYHEHET